jgi:hygromycin-B 4-O-kinase
VSPVTALVGGEWAKAYAFHVGEQELVARFSATDEDFQKDRVAAGYASTDLPTPRVIEIGPAPGAFFAISEYIGGKMLDELGKAEMRATLPSLFAMLDAMRLADISTTSGFGGWDTTGNAPFETWPAYLLSVLNTSPTSRTVGWLERLATSPTGDGPFQAAYERLQSLAADLPSQRYLVHADLLNRNVVVSGPRIAGVLDWGCAMFGDFLYDLAWFCFWAPWYPDWDSIDFAGEAARHYATIGLDVPNFDQRLRACSLHIGLDGQKYNAFRERWANVEAVAQRTLEMANA